MQGSLERDHLPQIIRSLNHERESGILQVSREYIKKRIYFGNGTMIFASSDYRADRLGEFLVRRGEMTPSHFELASTKVTETGQRFGASMVAMGLMTENEVKDKVREQILAIIFSMFPWHYGEYRFMTKEAPVAEDLAVKLPTSPVILEGVRRMNNPATIRRALGDLNGIVNHAKDPALLSMDVGLTPEEAFVLSRVDGQSSIADIVSISPIGDDETLRCVYALMSSGFLDIGLKSRELTPSKKKVPVVEQIFDRSGSQKKEMNPETEELSSEERWIRDDIIAKHSAIGSGTYYDWLEVRRTADSNEIKEAYHAIIKKYHPDRLRSPRLKDHNRRLEDIISKATDAYRVLNDSLGRHRYDTSLRYEAPRGEISNVAPSSFGSRETDAAAGMKGTAEHLFLEAKRCFANEDYHVTVELMEEAVRLDPSKSAYYALLALAQSRNPNWRDRAEENFQIALGKDPCDVAALVGLGELYVASGKRGQAVSMFSQALALDPDNEDLKRRTSDKARKATWKKMLVFWKN